MASDVGWLAHGDLELAVAALHRRAGLTLKAQAGRQKEVEGILIVEVIQIVGLHYIAFCL